MLRLAVEGQTRAAAAPDIEQPDIPHGLCVVPDRNRDPCSIGRDPRPTLEGAVVGRLSQSPSGMPLPVEPGELRITFEQYAWVIDQYPIRGNGVGRQIAEVSDLVRYWNGFARQLQPLCVEWLGEQCPIPLKDDMPETGFARLGRIGGEDTCGVGGYQGFRILCIGLQIQRTDVNGSSACLGARAIIQEVPAIRQEMREKTQRFRKVRCGWETTR